MTHFLQAPRALKPGKFTSASNGKAILSQGAVWLALVTLALGACQSEQSEPVAESTTPSSPTTIEAQTSVTASTPAAEIPEKTFWNALNSLCDQSFRGQLTIGTEESDREIGLADLSMHAKRCTRNAIDIGFHVDDDTSRTWMFRRNKDVVSLHHRHIGEDGKPDATSGYGGVAQAPGDGIRQEFPADENTGNMIPAAATNVWAIEIIPGDKFAYELQRIEEQRMFRVVFDLTAPIGQ